eukprot:TRINITY_DN2490_c0_g1_i1.p2 TRINITY_DN2490_c0_g1~~TRINITY_DN2490_c0_g1_i1.p2  ORF type:complete len:164 (+),score=16.98 TRINITY_DN2490_c0_g1_i1:280-771(+)
MRESMSKGFMTIAKYIFGENVSKEKKGSDKIAMTAPVITEKTKNEMKEKIAMTAPVRTEVAGDSQYKISFVMPSKYTMETLPQPKDDNVRLTQVPTHTVAALLFKGRIPSKEKIDKKGDILRKVLQENGIEPVGDLMFYGYQPPFWPPFLRENEVIYKVEYSE